MEKIDTDYQQRNSKIEAKFFKPFNHDATPPNSIKWLASFRIYEVNKGNDFTIAKSQNHCLNCFFLNIS